MTDKYAVKIQTKKFSVKISTYNCCTREIRLKPTNSRIHSKWNLTVFSLRNATIFNALKTANYCVLIIFLLFKYILRVYMALEWLLFQSKFSENEFIDWNPLNSFGCSKSSTYIPSKNFHHYDRIYVWFDEA